MKEAGARTSEGRSWQPRRAGRLEGGLAKEAGGREKAGMGAGRWRRRAGRRGRLGARASAGDARAKQSGDVVGPRPERSGSGSKF